MVNGVNDLRCGVKHMKARASTASLATVHTIGNPLTVSQETVVVTGRLGTATLVYSDPFYWTISVAWYNDTDTVSTGVKSQKEHVEKGELIKLMSLWVKVPYTVSP